MTGSWIDSHFREHECLGIGFKGLFRSLVNKCKSLGWPRVRFCEKTRLFGHSRTWLDHNKFLSGNKNNNVAVNILSESSSLQILFKRWVLIEDECRCATDVSTVEEWNILTTDIDSGCLSVSVIQSCGYDCISWRDSERFQGVLVKIQVGKWTRQCKLREWVLKSVRRRAKTRNRHDDGEGRWCHWPYLWVISTVIPWLP